MEFVCVCVHGSVWHCDIILCWTGSWPYSEISMLLYSVDDIMILTETGKERLNTGVLKTDCTLWLPVYVVVFIKRIIIVSCYTSLSHTLPHSFPFKQEKRH